MGRCDSFLDTILCRRCTRALIVTVAIAGAASALQSQAVPAPEGPHRVGYWNTTLSAAADGPVRGAPRLLSLEVWYPAAERGALTATKRYTTVAVETTLVRQLDLSPDWASRIRTHAQPGAVIAAGRHPVVLFSHGLSWPIALYQGITEELASRGYIVIGINHPQGAVIDYGGGRVSPFLPVLPNGSEAARDSALARLTVVWTNDIRAVLNQLALWDAAPRSCPVCSSMELTRIALSGHSLGASAAAHLTDDPRVKAVAILEGRLRDTASTTLTVHAPLLHMIGEYNRYEMENRDYRASDGAPVYQAIVAGTGHAHFADVIAIYKSSAKTDWLDRHRYELEPQRILQITRDYLVAFLDRYLRQIDSVLLHPTSYAARVDSPRAAGYAEVRLSIDSK